MLPKMFKAIEGYKTYIIAVVGILMAFIGHFWGPVTIGPFSIPEVSWNDVWTVVWNGGLFAALRHGVESSGSPTKPA